MAFDINKTLAKFGAAPEESTPAAFVKRTKAVDYVNYNRHGQNIGHNSIMPYNIQQDGCNVTFSGQMSQKTFDIINSKGLISHSVVGSDIRVCPSRNHAEQLVELLEENPNYKRGN